VAPRVLRSDGGCDGGSIDVLRGVRIPDGVDVPLKFRLVGIPDVNVGILDDLFMPPFLVGAGLAVLGVLGLGMVLPNAEIPSLPETFVIVVPPTDNRDGRGVDVPDELPPSRRCGIREGVASSVLSSESEDP